jgi:nickel-type superoxide dismutase maturation protease
MRFPIEVFKVKDRSMEPAISDGDYVVVSAFSGIKVGDIVVLLHPKGDFPIVKRVAKLTGDYIEVRGDNPALSKDSREFGRVRRSSLIGKVLLKI